jgi:hypothetical protein
MMRFKNISLVIFTILVCMWLGAQVFYHSLTLEVPEVPSVSLDIESVTEQSGTRRIDSNWYRQNEKGLWEAYVEGAPYERGLTFGLLAQRQIVFQEESFVAQIRKLVPSEWFLKTLKYGVVFFNRNLTEHISVELQQEIYGVSKSFSDEFDFIGDKFSRILNYHAAHDIGHALQDLSIVGCTSFAVWDQYTTDSSLIVGRNFDFYMGDEFAKNKVVLFMKPDSGYAFASITWAGFMGVVSGMNEHGLTVTLNAAKSEVPNGAKTPISLLAREILQYARTIEEAYAIARSRETFVSESILVASADDHAAAIIEKSPDRIDIFRPNDSRLVSSNHYQSETFKYDSVNVQNIRNSDSNYRFLRMSELIDKNKPIAASTAVQMLRERDGVGGWPMSMGNPNAINQLLAHHGIVFQPEKKRFWISANPFQLGEFVCYDLNEIFNEDERDLSSALFNDSLTIRADTFLESVDYQNFLRYKELKNRLFDNIVLGKEIVWNEKLETEFIASNRRSYVVYSMLGDYYLERGNLEKAKKYYYRGMEGDVLSKIERDNLMAKYDGIETD